MALAQLSRLLARYFDIRGSYQFDLAPDLIATMALEVQRPEWEYLAGSRLCWGSAGLAAGGAGTRSMVQLWNPPGSGVLCIIEELYARRTDTGGILLHVQTTPAALTTAAGGEFSRDFRDGGGVTLQFRTQAAALPAGGTRLYRIWEVSTPDVKLCDGAFMLDPGSGVIISPDTDQKLCQINVLWRERVLNPSEA